MGSKIHNTFLDFGDTNTIIIDGTIEKRVRTDYAIESKYTAYRRLPLNFIYTGPKDLVPTDNAVDHWTNFPNDISIPAFDYCMCHALDYVSDSLRGQIIYEEEAVITVHNIYMCSMIGNPKTALSIALAAWIMHTLNIKSKEDALTDYFIPIKPLTL